MKRATNEEVIAKYKHVAQLPDWLFGFTFPLRRRAIAKLALQPGDRVLDVGCGSGPNFSLLREAVGPSGEVVGFDLSPDMIQAAKSRIAQKGWDNVRAFQASAEEVELNGEVDGLVMFAMHDVFTSEEGLSNVIRYLKPGGRIVAAGPVLIDNGPARFMNPMIQLLFHRFAASTADMDQPWREMAKMIPNLKIKPYLMGAIFLAWGVKNSDK